MAEKQYVPQIGDPIEHEGQLARVLRYGYGVKAHLPGQTPEYDSEPTVDLQISPEDPTTDPKYIRHVPAKGLKKLEDKRRLELEKDEAKRLGLASPAIGTVPAETKDDATPEIRQQGPAADAKWKQDRGDNRGTKEKGPVGAANTAKRFGDPVPDSEKLAKAEKGEPIADRGAEKATNKKAGTEKAGAKKAGGTKKSGGKKAGKR